MPQTPSVTPRTRAPQSVLTRLRYDPLAWGVVALFVACNLFYLMPFVGPELRRVVTVHVAPLIFLSWVIAALVRSLGHLESRDERRFWIDLAAAYGCWLSSRLVHLLVPESMTRAVVEDLLYALFYLAMVMALERRVHRRSEWRPTHLERALTWPGVAVFVTGIVLYFVVIPLRSDSSLYVDGLPSLHFYASLDIYLTLTCIYLARTSPSTRWRVLYGLMTVAVGTTLLSDLSELMGFFRGWELGSRYDGLWNIPLVAMALTARLRHTRLETTEPGALELTTLQGNLSGPSGRTLVMGLAFPIAHFTGYAADVLDLQTRDQRETLVFWWLLLLTCIAVIQHRVLQRQILSMSKDRENFEASLRNSEKDLRFMVERRHTDEKLRMSELKFFKAFRASPDIMVITSLENRHLVEVNDSFERVIGYRREDAVGRTDTELNVWADPEQRLDMARRLRQNGHVKDREITFRRRDGELGKALFSAEVIHIDGESSLLSVSHDVTVRRELEAQLAAATEFLEELQTPLLVTDAGHRVVYWNTQAEDLFGWPEAEALERPLSELLFPELESESAVDDAVLCVQTEGHWDGILEARHRDGSTRSVEAWWSRITSERSRPQSQLMLIIRPLGTPPDRDQRA